MTSIPTTSNRGVPTAAPTSLVELKAQVKAGLERLEEVELVTRQDGYQGIADAIVADLRNKHRRRQQLQLERAALEATLQTLAAKRTFLEDQQKSYSDYISGCLQHMKLHAGAAARKRRSVMPSFFGRQARHVRELERRQQVVPKFGGYKYTVRELMDRGVIQSIQVEGLSTKAYDKLHVSLSSDAQGIIDITCGFTALGIPLPNMEEHESVKLEDLLALQFENKAHTDLFDGCVTVNVNILIYFINKKFYARA